MQHARPGEDPREGLLHEVLGVLARTAQRPRGAIEAVDVLASDCGSRVCMARQAGLRGPRGDERTLSPRTTTRSGGSGARTAALCAAARERRLAREPPAEPLGRQDARGNVAGDRREPARQLLGGTAVEQRAHVGDREQQADRAADLQVGRVRLARRRSRPRRSRRRSARAVAGSAARSARAASSRGAVPDRHQPGGQRQRRPQQRRGSGSFASPA